MKKQNIENKYIKENFTDAPGIRNKQSSRRECFAREPLGAVMKTNYPGVQPERHAFRISN